MTEIEMDFAPSYPEPTPREDGKYQFAIELGDLDGESPAELIEILTSPEAQALDEPWFEFDPEHRNGVGVLMGWREATPEELGRLRAKRDQSTRWRQEHDRQELDRIKKAHPDWLKEGNE